LYDLILLTILNQLNFHDFDFDFSLKSSQMCFYPTLVTAVVCVIGNDNLHSLTSERRQRLHIDLTDSKNNKNKWATYDEFEVASEDEKYKLLAVGSHSGNAGTPT